MPRPTLAQIADLAGVSKSTAAYVLNGGPAHITFSAATREKVEAVARAVGYRANLSARATATGRTGGIALLHAGGPLPDDLLWAIHDRAAQHGLALTLARLPDPQLADPAHVPAILATYAVDGVLVVGVVPAPTAVRSAIDRLRIPAIAVGCPGPRDTVACDDEGAGREAAEHLLRLGHRKLAFVAGDPADPVEARRGAGWAAALRTAGMRARVIDGAALSAALAAPDRPTALAAGGDPGDTLHAVPPGLAIGRDLALVGFGPRPWRLTDLSVTTWVAPLATLGRTAVDLLRARIAAPDTPLPGLVLPGQLVSGRSTAPG
jgi:LacI family transcriptional regulator